MVLGEGTSRTLQAGWAELLPKIAMLAHKARTFSTFMDKVQKDTGERKSRYRYKKNCYIVHSFGQNLKLWWYQMVQISAL